MMKRELYLNRIRPFIGQDIVKIISGIRRCGKSVMLELIQAELLAAGLSDEQILAVNFESKGNAFSLSVDAVYTLVRDFTEKHSGKVYLFFDEIQELDGWEKMVNACLVDFDVDIYLTGSNAKLLSSELSTYLAGRYVEFKIYPLSFREVVSLLPNMALSEAFNTYLIRGGMPFIYQFPIDESSAMMYLNDIYNSIILKDIASRNKIRDLELLRRVLLFLLANVGNTFSAASVTQFMKNEKRSVSTETIYNYIDYCKTACFLHLLSREDVIGKRILQFQEKIYIADHGIRQAVYGHNMRDINQTLENIVYLELLRRGYSVNIGKSGQNEIDFIAAAGRRKIYVQVTYLLASAETMEREFSVLEKIPDNYPKYVVSMDDIDRGRSGIVHMNIRDFLMSDAY